MPIKPGNTQRKVCLIIGDPVEHSLSPAMHNAAYIALNISSQYTFFAWQVKQEELANAMKEDLRAPEIHAFACTVPHKETIINYLDEIDEVAKQIGAVNTVINNNGVLKGYNTDWKGGINALLKLTSLKGKKVALLGSGGTAHAIAYGLSKKNCKVSIYSRNIDKALDIAKQYKYEPYPWEIRGEACDADIIINTTSIGRDDNESPLIGIGINKNHVVFDVNYKSGGTQLLKLAKSKNAAVIGGLEMLLQQGMLQFELYTGLKAPEKAMKEALTE